MLAGRSTAARFAAVRSRPAGPRHEGLSLLPVTRERPAGYRWRGALTCGARGSQANSMALRPERFFDVLALPGTLARQQPRRGEQFPAGVAVHRGDVGREPGSDGPGRFGVA